MLAHLRIQNYALIRRLEIDIHSGLNIITGETGTGKSIILGALGLILGNRADSSSQWNKEQKCIIEGRFSISAYGLQSFFDQNDLDYEDETLLRREIAPGGKSRAFINDTPVNLNVLKELGESLIDIHSQHQTLRLGNAAFQMNLLDAFAKHKNILDEYFRNFKEYKRAQKQLSVLKEKSAQAKKDHDYFLFQLNEITNANLQTGEFELLEEELNVLSNAELIEQRLQQAVHILYESETSVFTQLGELKKSMAAISGLNATLAQLTERINSVTIEIKDIYAEADDFKEGVSVDNERLEEVNARIQTINNLLQKHRLAAVNELLAYAEELKQKIGENEELDEEIIRLETHISAVEKMLEELAVQITNGRSAQIQSVEQNLVSLLREVGIPEAQIQIKLNALSQLSETGKDAIDILFSANKGSAAQSIGEVASGGELSRLMLCFKYLLADSIFLPTIVFDEIDTGVSGEVAIKIGQILQRLSKNHQVISITHQPQVAAMGNHHFVVYKISGDDFTETNIKALPEQDRVNEIAKMIAGHKPSQLAIENAKELLSTYSY